MEEIQLESVEVEGVRSNSSPASVLQMFEQIEKAKGNILIHYKSGGTLKTLAIDRENLNLLKEKTKNVELLKHFKSESDVGFFIWRNSMESFEGDVPIKTKLVTGSDFVELQLETPTEESREVKEAKRDFYDKFAPKSFTLKALTVGDDKNTTTVEFEEQGAIKKLLAKKGYEEGFYSDDFYSAKELPIEKLKGLLKETKIPFGKNSYILINWLEVSFKRAKRLDNQPGYMKCELRAPTIREEDYSGYGRGSYMIAEITLYE